MLKFSKFSPVAVLLLSLSFTPARVSAEKQPTEQPYSYWSVTIVGGGFVSGLVAHPTAPGVMYARTDVGGAYRWDPFGRRWTPLLDFLSPSQANLYGVETIALDPQHPNRVYVGAGLYGYASNCCAFLVSDDYGVTFKSYPAPFGMSGGLSGNVAGERLAVNPFAPSELFMGTRFKGLWVSEDRAQTWTQVASFPILSTPGDYGVQWVVFDSRTKGRLYAGSYTDALIYLSTDDGKTWAALPGMPRTWPSNVSAFRPPSPIHALVNRDGNLYVVFVDFPNVASAEAGLVQKYNPQTQTWTDITPPIDAPYQTAPAGGFGGLTQDTRRPGVVAVSTLARIKPVDTIYLTQNGGTNWTNLGLVTSSAGDDGPPDGNYYFDTDVFTPISPYLSIGGTNIPNTPNLSARFGTSIAAILIDPTQPDHFLYGSGLTVYGTRNLSAAFLGASPKWRVQARGIEEAQVLTLISPSAGSHLLSGDLFIGGFEHTDLQVSPQSGMFTNPVADSVDSLDWAGQNPGFLVRTQSPLVYSLTPCNFGAYSSDGGTSWSPFGSCAVDGINTSDRAISVDASGATVMWSPGLGTTQPVQFSLDKGNTWLRTSGLPMLLPTHSDKVTPQVFYAYYNGSSGGAFYSTTVNTTAGTAAFAQVNTTALPNTASCTTIGCGPIAVNWAKAGDIWLPLAGNGLYHSTDGGVTWTQIAGVANAGLVAVGATSPTKHNQAVFLYGQPSSSAAMALYRSDDNGQTWIRINDNKHQYGAPVLLVADPRVFGRVYLGTSGRGILYGDPGLF